MKIELTIPDETVAMFINYVTHDGYRSFMGTHATDKAEMDSGEIVVTLKATGGTK